MIRHDLQFDVIEAHRALRSARTLCTSPGVLDHITKAHDRVFEIADKLGVDLKEIDQD
jgi:hypothetical protein